MLSTTKLSMKSMATGRDQLKLRLRACFACLHDFVPLEQNERHNRFDRAVASNKDGTLPNPERNKDSVFECVLQSMKDFVGASFAQT